MNQFNLWEYSAVLTNVVNGLITLSAEVREGKGGHTIDPELTKKALQQVIDFANGLKMVDCSDSTYASLAHLKGLTNSDVSTLAEKLRQARDALMREAYYRKFLWVAPTKGGYIDQGSLFGSDVARAFPSASYDIVEAGNCLALECSTAAVFHLMRVAEVGLRAIAFDRRVKLPKNKPLNLATWEDLLKQLEAAETDIQGWPKTHAREAQFEFVHGAMMELKRFKNVFRNRVAHTRESYDWAQAHSVFQHVQDFMKILATRISETTRTPKIWTGAKWTTV